MELQEGPIPFSFLPGQFLTFSAEIDGKRIQRSYTIASSPTQSDYVEITVKREDQGVESGYLHDNVATGDHLEVSGPAGVFTFTGTETDSIVLISGGVGITPMMCVTRYLTDRNFTGDIFFLHGAGSPKNYIFREELEYLANRHENLHLLATMESAEGTVWKGAIGVVTKEFIARSVPEIARHRVHVCGPPAMLAAVQAALAELKVPKDKIKTESFGAAKGAAPALPAAASSAPAPATAPPSAPTSPGDTAAPAPSAGAAPAAPADAAPAAAAPSALIPSADAATPATPAVVAAAAPSAQAEVQFSKSGKTGPLAPDQPVLEAAEAIGVTIDFSCRVGICGICVVPLLKGSVTMAVEEGLRPEDKARGIILACQAKSAGNLVVDA
jgi:ferredoxin-NADP reductase/ferredoxin